MRQEAAISNSQTYKDAGVDIDAGDALVEAIKPLAAATRRRGADAALGGFGALFDLKAAGFKDPVLVASTDGVGTKLKVAIETGLHDGVGIDLVAMCVNDIVVQGAEPLFFLDYFATSRLDVTMGKAVVAGIAKGCEIAGCALIGGETAEMPGMYAKGDYDLAGFSVGAVERDRLLTGSNIKVGDVLLGLASSGVHSNGFSLVRHLVTRSGLSYDAPAPFAPGKTLGQALLEPTRIYVKPCIAAINAGLIKGLAHITGGGLVENIPRVLPKGTVAAIDATKWERPKVFDWLQEIGQVTDHEMARTFNCGIGMVLVVPAVHAGKAKGMLEGEGETVFEIGRLEAGASDTAEAETRLTGTERAWHG